MCKLCMGGASTGWGQGSQKSHHQTPPTPTSALSTPPPFFWGIEVTPVSGCVALMSRLTFLNLAYLENLNNIIYLIWLLRDLIKCEVSSTGLRTEQVPYKYWFRDSLF